MAMVEEEKILCARWWADRLQIPDKRDDFERALLPKIRDGIVLKVDYDPDPVLLKALSDAGIECYGPFSAKGILPSKTVMKIRSYGDDIRVAEGRGGPFTSISLENDNSKRPAD